MTDLKTRIKNQEARMEHAELKWEAARQAGHPTRARIWEMQYEVECEGLDELLIEEMERDFAEAMSGGAKV